MPPPNRTLAWQAKRNRSLSDPEGWLALAGLFPLPAGEHVLGSAVDCDIRFPAGTPERLGFSNSSSRGPAFQRRARA
jgi:hypothetical protein